MPAARRPPCSYSYAELVALPFSPYKLEGPGFLYFPLRGTATSDIDTFLDGTPLSQAQFDALEIKAGHTAIFERRFGEYRCMQLQRTARPHRRLLGALFTPPRDSAPVRNSCSWTRSLTELLPERLIHLKLKSKRASLAPVPCTGCKKNHREFYSLADAGDLTGFKKLVEEVFLDLGVPFGWELLEDPTGVTGRKANAFTVSSMGTSQALDSHKHLLWITERTQRIHILEGNIVRRTKTIRQSKKNIIYTNTIAEEAKCRLIWSIK
ncbi:hypothetical protein B0H14DRAFT_2575175 [Mycena olivaceomarginata]|nr:hypothetical protein B0H14DRAFT_2575175 [Mycena olivaceomarginata]